jgi:Dolichyl-phosphate-mannose-protein mannosyltransferase
MTTAVIERPATSRPSPVLLSGAWHRVREWLPVLAVLVAQAVYTIRLVPMGFASTDEARYITAGHQLIHELFHGGGSPFYETYFSGAPDIYPPLAAVADRLGGITEVRLMSMVFMLTATVLLYLTARRLFGYWPAVLSAALFAGLGTTQVVGRNATYDAMAFMLTGAAAYYAVRTDEGSDRRLLLVPAMLLLANATKYMTVAFDPVVIGLAATRGGMVREMVRRAVALGTMTVILLGVAVFIAGSAYLKGIEFTTFSGQKGGDELIGAMPVDPRGIVLETWDWIGITIALAVLAVIAALISRAGIRDVFVLVLCLFGSLIITIEAVHLHSSESMRRHDDLAAWFAAIPAGYALAFPSRLSKRHWLAVAGVVLGGLVIVASWVHYGQLPSTFYQASAYDTANVPQEDPLFGFLRPYVADTQRFYLVDGLNDFSLFYYDRVGIPWYRMIDDSYINYPIPGRGGDWQGHVQGEVCTSIKPGCMYLEGSAGFEAAIYAHTFAVISITRTSLLRTDLAIIQAAEHTPGYVLLTTLGGGHTWIYAPDYEHFSTGGK